MVWQALENAFVAAATEHRKQWFPIAVGRAANELVPTMNGFITSISDLAGVMKGEAFKVIFMNMSFLGPESARVRSDLKAMLMSMVSADDARTCGLIVAPTVGEHGNAYNDEHIEKATRDLLDDLRDDSGVLVKPITFMFDVETMWSESRLLSHNVFMCISKKAVNKQLASTFASSQLWVRGGLPGLVKVLPRTELVNPTVRIATGDSFNLGKERERKQWITGPSLHNALANSLWVGMGLNAKHLAIWLDVLPYDGHLPMSCVSRSGVLVAREPSEACVSIVWSSTASDNKAIEGFVDKRLRSFIRTQCTKGVYKIPGAPDITNTSVNQPVGTSPSYNEAAFKLTKPMADQTLPLRKDFVDKWLAPGVPEALKDEFRSVLLKHDTEFNKSGVAFSGDTIKRKATESAPGENSVLLAPAQGCPQSRADVQAQHGDIRMKEFDGWNLLVAQDGTIFAECLGSVQGVLASEPLAMVSGEWVVGAEFEKSKKQGIRPGLIVLN